MSALEEKLGLLEEARAAEERLLQVKHDIQVSFLELCLIIVIKQALSHVKLLEEEGENKEKLMVKLIFRKRP